MKKNIALALITIVGMLSVAPAMADKGKHCDCEKCATASKDHKDCDCGDAKCKHHDHHKHKDAKGEEKAES